MIQVFNSIYVGSQIDFETIRQNQTKWGILHCCKDPYHKELVRYQGNLSPTHPDYAYKINGNRMALNLVDMDTYSEKYLDFNKTMFIKAFEFLDLQRQLGKNVLIHCNLGESRAPSIALLYLSRLGVFNGGDFITAYSIFQGMYPNFTPRKNIITTVKNLWNYFTKYN